MKKFLSILLAVMMVLSTASFAAPSAFTAIDSAKVEADVVAEEVVADLAAEVNKASFGTLIYKVDFENDNFDVNHFSTAYSQLKNGTTASYINSAFDTSNVTTYTNAAGDGFSNAQLVTEGGNTYITGDVASGYDGFFRMTKYNMAWPEGYYTFCVDVKAPAGQASGFAQQCNDTAIALTTVSGFDTANGDWQTVVNRTTDVVNGASIYGYFVTPANAAAGTVSYDNWEVYYRPATVTLTIGGVDYELPTDVAYSADKLASYVEAPTGYTLSGISLTEGGELLAGERYYFEDTTLYPVFAKDTTIHDTYGKPLFIIDFENAAAQNWWGHSAGDNSATTHGAQAWEVATKYDAIFQGMNYRVRFLINESTHVDQVTKEENGNHFTEGTAASMWPQITLSNWAGPLTYKPGIYTFVVDTRPDSAPSDFRVHAPWTRLDTVGIPAAGKWSTIVAQQTLTADAPSIPDGAPVINYSFGAAGETVAFDNAILYYKPLTADVTLSYKGEEFVAEDVSTGGVSADAVVAASGIEIPYGKKAVLSATIGGESVGNVINLISDAKFYVTFVDDDTMSEYGKRILFIDFEKFDAGYELPDNSPVSGSTDDFHGDWAHLTVNYEVGNAKGVVSDENGNKIVKGTQGWAQIRINNANFETAPAGYYTMALKVKNYGSEEKFLSTKDQVGGTSATWVKAGAVTGTTANYPIVNGVWNEVAAELAMPTKDFTIYHTNAMTTDVAFDDIALYYRPASVNLTVVDLDGNEIVYEDTDSVVDTDKLLADIPAPFGYRVGLATEADGEPLTGEINLVSDAKLYAVLVEDDRFDLNYGKAMAIIDFERESMQGWDGNSQTLDNAVPGNGVQVFESASYYDPRFEGNNYRIRFVINETTGLIDQKIVADENGNHYTTGTNTTRWPQVVSTNWGNVQGEAGVYTFMFDVKIEATTESNITMSNAAFNGGAVTVVDAFSGVAGEWDTVVVQSTMDAAGALPKGTWGNFGFAANETTTLSFDNAKIYYKPLYADIEVRANGETVKTISGVSTETGVTVDRILEGVKVKGYTITGVRFGDKTYVAGETIVAPCDAHVDLALEVAAIDPATPEVLDDDKSVRAGDISGLRFKAALSKAEMEDVTAFGWVVTREELLIEAGISANNFEKDSNVKKSLGYNYGSGTDVAKIFEQDDDTAWFTAVLYFQNTEDDGLPSAEKLCGKLVARPFAVVDGEYLYGDPTTPASIFDVALDYYYENTDDQGNYFEVNETSDYVDAVLAKCDSDGPDGYPDDIPDIWQ